jgi:hypothetical protein
LIVIIPCLPYFVKHFYTPKSSIKSDMEAGRGRTIASLHLVTVLLHTEVLSGGRRQAFCLLSPFIEKEKIGDLSQGTPFHVIHPDR